MAQSNGDMNEWIKYISNIVHFKYISNDNNIATDITSLRIYQDLINMGYDGAMSMKAITLFPKNINECIKYIKYQYEAMHDEKDENKDNDDDDEFVDEKDENKDENKDYINQLNKLLCLQHDLLHHLQSITGQNFPPQQYINPPPTDIIPISYPLPSDNPTPDPTPITIDDSMDHRFGDKYPAKNGPIAIAKRLGIPMDKIPAFDPHDEIFGDPVITQNLMSKYGEELDQLSFCGYSDHNKNLRYLLRMKEKKDRISWVIEQYLTENKFEGIYIGDRVIRGIDWKWKDQDGGIGHEGTVRALKHWHPMDAINKTTEVVVLWDHGLYGNYRFGYKSAFDVKVIDRNNGAEALLLNIGQRVMRKQENWRWGNQDGVPNGIGTVIELYASPAPFEGGCRVGVLWDHQKIKYKKAAEEYLKLHPNGDDEWYQGDDEQEINDHLTNDEILEKFKKFDVDPHKVRRKRGCYKKRNIPYIIVYGYFIGFKLFNIPNDIIKLCYYYYFLLFVARNEREMYHKFGDNVSNNTFNMDWNGHSELLYESDEHSSDWDEPDFDEILSKPIAKYRWSLPDPKSDFGVAQDLEIAESKDIPERRFLMIDDRVQRSMYFKARRKEPKSEACIVLKVEQSDPQRVNPDQIKGDKVYTTWSSHQSYSFQSDDGVDDIIFYKRGQIFQDKWSRIKVGDRVRRGLTWKHEYGNEDGGHEKKGSVVCLQYVLQTKAIMAKVRWDNTGHINFYSWALKKVP